MWVVEPYRVFFPLGLVLTWVAVVPWLAFGLGWLAAPPVLTHALLQVQGFLTCFVLGFLGTAIPKRTATPALRAWQVVVIAALLVVAAGGMLAGSRGPAQACWLAAMGFAATAIVGRLWSRAAGRRPPRSFLWIPVGFLCAFLGAVVIGVYAGLGEAWFVLHELGRDLILQGMLFAFVVGVGGMLIPLITRGAVAPDAGPDAVRTAAHVAAVALLFGSFAIEAWWSVRAAHAVRAVLALAVLVAEAGIHRRPTVGGAHRVIVWASAWAIPLGYGWGALQPAHASAALHVVLLGGFGAMALAVGAHVVFSHGGARQLVSGRPWQVLAMAGALVLALATRIAAVLDPVRYQAWVAAAAAAYLVATACWAWVALPWLWRRP